MPAVASVDGVITALADARVPVTDRGLLFGDHAFEIVRGLGPWLVDGEAHLARLTASARSLGIVAPELGRLADWIAAAVAASGEPDTAIRIVWTRGDGTRLRPSAGAPPRAIIIVEPSTAAPSGDPSGDPSGPDGLRLVSIAVEHAGRTGALVPATAKTGSYLASILALARAAELGADDALLVDPDGRALETATSSLFVVVAGRAIVATGAALPGVTAARVAALLGEVVFAAVDAATLAAADELFVTSSRRGVTPVVGLDGRVFAVGPTTRRAIDRYQRWLAARIAPPAL